ncbi:hypothetical protein DSO57_1036208 [Entomophthora muscae]|uniref:Uncharacterized protein n=1 Tax=Entomophthora muscae TaxID=34485 RepID=A0ACC2TXG9_9FUNG|nr:hypothetical protein DSO57_1036208 [Entomophthora muscae]
MEEAQGLLGTHPAPFPAFRDQCPIGNQPSAKSSPARCVSLQLISTCLAKNLAMLFASLATGRSRAGF